MPKMTVVKKIRETVILYVVFYRSVCGLIFRQTDYFGIMVLFLRQKNIYLMQRNLVPLPHL